MNKKHLLYLKIIIIILTLTSVFIFYQGEFSIKDNPVSIRHFIEKETGFKDVMLLDDKEFDDDKIVFFKNPYMDSELKKPVIGIALLHKGINQRYSFETIEYKTLPKSSIVNFTISHDDKSLFIILGENPNNVASAYYYYINEKLAVEDYIKHKEFYCKVLTYPSHMVFKSQKVVHLDDKGNTIENPINQDLPITKGVGHCNPGNFLLFYPLILFIIVLGIFIYFVARSILDSILNKNGVTFTD